VARAKRGAGWPRRLPNGRWQAQVSRTEGGRRIRDTRSFDLKTDADWWLAQAKRGHLPDADLSVSEYLDRWLRGKRDIRESTRTLYRSHIEVHIKRNLGSFELLDLRARHIEAFVDGLPVSPSTSSSILRTLRMALEDAVRRHDLPENPAAHVKPPRVERKPVEPLTEADAAALIEAVRGSWIELVVRFLFGSGCRIGEARDLDQRDVQAGFVIIRDPKTVPRATMISEDAQAALAEAIRIAPRVGPHEPVFFGPRTGDRIDRSTVNKALRRLAHTHPHAIRHSVATLMVGAGIPMRVVADQLGHADPSMTARVYAHVLPQSRRDAIAVLDRVAKENG
jgi:integrase